MKLIDFTRFMPLNDLLSRMDAKIVEYDTDQSWDGLDTNALLRQLEKQGVDIELQDVEFCEDETLEYKGQKVLIYIRDQYVNVQRNYQSHRSKRKSSYKFHIANCRTLSDAFRSNRKSRYVISNRTDGLFVVNLIDRSRNVVVENESENLSKCA